MNTQINVTIVEDDFFTSDFIKRVLIANGYHVVDICNSYDSFISSLKIVKPDIVLLDIWIDGEKSGIDIAEYLKDTANIPFVFITSMSDKQTINTAKKTLPRAYLIKPFDEEDLYAVIEVALMNVAQSRNNDVRLTENDITPEKAIFIRQKKALIKILEADILYIRSRSNYVQIFTLTDDHIIRQSLNDIQQILPTYFYRVHRSFTVNLHCIQQIRYEELLLTNNVTIPLSRSIYPDLIERVQMLKS